MRRGFTGIHRPPPLAGLLQEMLASRSSSKPARGWSLGRISLERTNGRLIRSRSLRGGRSLQTLAPIELELWPASAGGNRLAAPKRALAAYAAALVFQCTSA